MDATTGKNRYNNTPNGTTPLQPHTRRLFTKQRLVMFGYCDVCGYDTGDFDARPQIYERLEEDGGSVVKTGTTTIRGLEVDTVEITCPNGHEDSFRID